MTDFLLHVGWLTLSMSALILLCLLFIKLGGKRFSAKSRYILWTVVVLTLIVGVGLYRLPSLFTLEVPLPEVTDTPAASPNVMPDSPTVTLTPITPDTDEFILSTPPDYTPEPLPPELTEHAFTAEMPRPTVPTVPEKEPFTVDVPMLIFHIWAVGAVAFFTSGIAVYMASTVKYSRGKKLCEVETAKLFDEICQGYGITKKPKLYICTTVGSPVLYGYFSPTVLLPDMPLTKNSLIGVLSHELTHYRRGDTLIKLVCLAAEALHWFNPLVHIAAARCNAEMELSCDEAVLAGMDEDVRRSYGNVMLEIVKHCKRRRSLLTTQYSPHKNAVKERFLNILDMTKKKRGRVVIASVLALCVIAGVIVGCRFANNKKQAVEVYTVADGVSAVNSELFADIDTDSVRELVIGKDVENIDFAYVNSFKNLEKITVSGENEKYQSVTDEYGVNVLLSPATGEMLYIPTKEDQVYFDIKQKYPFGFTEGENIRAYTCGAVLTVYFTTDDIDAYWFLKSIEYDGVTENIGYDKQISGNCSFRCFRFDGGFVASHAYYSWSNAFIFKDGACIEYNPKSAGNFEYDISADGDGVAFYPDDDGKLLYVRTTEKMVAMQTFDWFLSLTSAEDFWKEEGVVTISDSELIFTPTATYTVTDYANERTRTLEEEFRILKDNGAIPEYDTLEEMFAANKAKQSGVAYKNLTDFLTAEQIAVYEAAHDLFRLFVGEPAGVEGLHFDGSYSESEGRYEGSNFTYIAARGKYRSYPEFRELCLTAFTDEYFDELNRTGTDSAAFIEHDSRLYYRNTTMGGEFGRDIDMYPDTYELISRTDREIRFNVIGYYKDSGGYDPIYSLYRHAYPITMVLTEDGWRFSLFSNTGLSENQGKGEKVLDAYFGKNSIAELLRMLVLYQKSEISLDQWFEENELTPTKFTVCDLDGDYRRELILWLAYGSNDYYGYLILQSDGEAVYAHLIYHRAFNEVKTDGTFTFSGGVSDSGVGKLEFSNGAYTVRELADDSAQSAKTDVTWTAISMQENEVLLTDLTALFKEAEAAYAMFTGYGSPKMSGKAAEINGTTYGQVLPKQFADIASLRAHCNSYFTEELTDKLLLKTVGEMSLYLDHDGSLWRFGGYAALWSYNAGAETTKYTLMENSGDTAKLKVSRTITEMGNTVTADVICTVEIEDGKLRFSDFSLPVEALWSKYDAAAQRIYQYEVTLDNGKTVTLQLRGSDPATSAEVYSAYLTYAPNRIVIHREEHGTGIKLEKAYVLDSRNGNQTPVMPVSDIIAQNVKVKSTKDAWVLTISGRDYPIAKSQFAGYGEGELHDTPNFDIWQDFSIDNGRLVCDVGILCAGNGTGFADEYIRIEYRYDAGKLVPSKLRVRSHELHEAVEAEWTKLITDKFMEIEWRTELVTALLRGDGYALADAVGMDPKVYECYNGIVIDDWSVRMITIDDYHGYSQDFTVLDITVSKSNAPALSPGKHSLVLEDGIWNRFFPLSDLTTEAEEYSSAEDYALSLTYYSSQFGICDFIVARLNKIAGDYEPRSAEEIKEYARVCLDIDPDTLKLDALLQKVDGGYMRIGRDGGSRAADIIGEEVRGGVTVVTVRYYADAGKTVEAMLVEYHLEKTDIDWKLVDNVKLRNSGFEVFYY